MRVEIITVGSELLLGEILNTNSQYLSEELNRLGYSVLYQTTVGDNKTRLAQALQLALQRADLVITSGGLGPTQGDLTKFVGAQVMRTPLYFDEGVYKAIEQWLQRRYTSPVITENQKRQAMIPQGATVFFPMKREPRRERLCKKKAKPWYICRDRRGNYNGCSGSG